MSASHDLNFNVFCYNMLFRNKTVAIYRFVIQLYLCLCTYSCLLFAEYLDIGTKKIEYYTVPHPDRRIRHARQVTETRCVHI